MSFVIAIVVLLGMLLVGAGESWVQTCRSASRQLVTSVPDDAALITLVATSLGHRPYTWRYCDERQMNCVQAAMTDFGTRWNF